MPNLLEKISDDELKSKQNSIKAMIRREQKADRDTGDLERELCWLERESECRQKRYDIHKVYMDKIRSEYEQMIQEEREAEKEMYKFDNDMSWRS